jgi:hypothetical protein
MIIPITVTPTSDIVVDQEMEEISFQEINVNEAKVEEFLRKNIGLIFEEEEGEETLLIVGQQVANLRRARNDLVALDAAGNLVLIEIKRDASDMTSRVEALEFQAVRYAATLATIRTVDSLVDRIFARYVEKYRSEFDSSNSLTSRELAKRKVDEFLKKNNADNSFNEKQRIILLSSSFDDQVLSAAAWMNKNGIDISCISLNPCRAVGSPNGPIYLTVDRLIPTPRVEDFFIDLREGPIEAGHIIEKIAGAKKAHTSLPRMSKLIEWGIVHPGDQLTLNGFEQSDATVIDAKTVKFRGKQMTFNEWGREVTGWSSICIYDWAVLRGQTLTHLRAERMRQDAKEKQLQDGGALAASE